jgi:hypothetical protein
MGQLAQIGHHHNENPRSERPISATSMIWNMPLPRKARSPRSQSLIRRASHQHKGQDKQALAALSSIRDDDHAPHLAVERVATGPPVELGVGK